MRFILPLVVALILFVAVGMVRYNALVAEDDRVAASRRAGCERIHDAAVEANPYGDPDAYSRMRLECLDRALDVTMAERSIPHYIFGAWLWGALAGLLGGLVTFLLMRRRRPAAASE